MNTNLEDNSSMETEKYENLFFGSYLNELYETELTARQWDLAELKTKHEALITLYEVLQQENAELKSKFEALGTLHEALQQEKKKWVLAFERKEKQLVEEQQASLKLRMENKELTAAYQTEKATLLQKHQAEKQEWITKWTQYAQQEQNRSQGDKTMLEKRLNAEISTQNLLQKKYEALEAQLRQQQVNHASQLSNVRNDFKMLLESELSTLRKQAQEEKDKLQQQHQEALNALQKKYEVAGVQRNDSQAHFEKMKADLLTLQNSYQLLLKNRLKEQKDWSEKLLAEQASVREKELEQWAKIHKNDLKNVEDKYKKDYAATLNASQEYEKKWVQATSLVKKLWIAIGILGFVLGFKFMS